MPPLTIAYRGNFSRPWCTEVHLAASLESLGHTVVRLQENGTTWADATEAAEGAHMFMWTRTWGLDPEGGHAALAAMRDLGVPSVSFHLDRYIGLDREAQIVDGDPFWRTDLVVTADGGHDAEFADYGVNHYFMPPGIYEREARLQPGPRARRYFPHDVVFVGTHPYPHAEWAPYRTELIGHLANTYGRRFKVWPERGRPLRGQALTDLYSSAQVVVGDSCLIGNPRLYWSDRIPETMGRGGYLIHPHVDGLADWYPELTTYPVGDFDDLIGKVDWALSHPAERGQLAAVNRQQVLDRDTYAHRMCELLDVVDQALGFGKPAPPKPKPVTVAATHRTTRQRATFRCAQGDTDAIAVREVWDDDTYKLTAGDVRGKHVVDIGANVGAFSVLAARLGARRVDAYEPHPDTGVALVENLTRHAGATPWAHHAAAVWTRPGWVRIDGDGGGANVGGWLPSDSAYRDAAGLWMPAVDAVSVIPDDGAVVKVDCEGSEYVIVDLWHRERTLERIERILMEFHGPVMPHLAHMDDGHQLDRFGGMLAQLAEYGRLDYVFGRPMVGGLLRWSRY